MKKTCIFDLDGTLVDSLIDLAETANEVLKSYGFQTHPQDKYRKFVGNGVTNLVRQALPESARSDTGFIEEVLEKFNALYRKTYLNNTRPYDGIVETVYSLKDGGATLAVLSNKPTEFTRKIIERYFRPDTFRSVYGKEPKLPPKPDPSLAFRIAKEINVPLREIFYIGDSDVDMILAKRAEMIPVGVTWGFRGRQELIDNGAKYICDSPEEILKIVL